ncbi:MAG TPA: 2-amino-4-hydroxy-6-hydroxymethyldihydropteridine diphosphokinase [Gemmatimonadota bacterium]|nr:2-amino-4-hydroxy-6-hydroxymethyldihydropteridine diphosphokinase [Gemmatimonadota bacterium]
MTARAYLALGSNMGERAALLGRARTALATREGIRLASCSATVETLPVDVTGQPDFLNQVLGVDTELSPRALLEAGLEIERELGRDRSAAPPKGPRTIDIDLLLYGGREVDEPGLTVPHPRLAERAFLLELCRQAGAPEAWIPAVAR